MTVYDKKGQAAGIQTWNVSDVKKDGNGFTSTINSVFTDEKGKEIARGAGTYKCNGGMLQADIKMAIAQQQAQGMQPNEASLNNSYLEYPNIMSVGQSLKDADFNMDMNMNTGIKANVTFKESNRKVEAKEKVTSPAGSWDAFVISYDSYMKIKMGIGIPMNFQVKEWFVPNFGIVKTETTKNGKVVGSTLITALTK
jgi:hypothetical protein